jgi:hypothetical protein
VIRPPDPGDERDLKVFVMHITTSGRSELVDLFHSFAHRHLLLTIVKHGKDETRQLIIAIIVTPQDL